LVSRRRRFLLPFLLTLTVIILALYFGSGIWLTAVGRALVSDDGPAPADAAVVLAGDFTGHRMNGGAELVRKELVPVVLVSGPAGMYGINEADAAIRFITARGFPADRFVAIRHTAMSTREEARVLLAELAKRQVTRVNVVTSNFHTRRARRIFLEVERERGGGPQIRMVATPDPIFDPETWWHSREGCKTAFLEWTKAITSLVGI
jgi:uncharacterized SAM-binding protein YcdF (DUF218 family)